MKMLIGTLLLTFTVFFHFRESGASIVLPEELRSLLTFTSHQRPSWTFYYCGAKVGVWLDHDGKVDAVGLESGNIIPDSIMRRRYQFRSFVEYTVDTFFLVHVLPNGYITGIENSPWNSYPRGPSRGPTTTITYQSRKIDVWKDPSGKAYAMRLQDRNIVPTGSECMEYAVTTTPAKEGDIHFQVYSLYRGYIVGVLLIEG